MPDKPPDPKYIPETQISRPKPGDRSMTEFIMADQSWFSSAPSAAGPGSTPWYAYRSDREVELDQKRTDLKLEVNRLQKKLEAERNAGAATHATLKTYEAKINELEREKARSFILDRIHPEAKEAFLASPEFQEEFGKRCEAFVLVADLRRSTELMLKARTPELFAQFVCALSNGLRNIVLGQHGVFEKFTGDGILAFFPAFYTGPDAGYYALSAASQCHSFFVDHYRKSYSCFDAVLSLSDIGLGVGIDYGEITLLRVGEELSIVGNPVVYACRLACAAAGTTLLNQQAYERVLAKFSGLCSLVETELDVKHEARHIAHVVQLNSQTYWPSEPAWKKFRTIAPPR